MKLIYATFVVSVAFISLVKSQNIELWRSEPRNNIWLQRQADLTFSTSSTGTAAYTINIVDTNRYQQMDGFGGSLTDASCWLFHYRLSASKRAEVLGNLFGPGGINLSLLRQPIGSSDFAWEAWTFGDTPNNVDDFQLNNFYLWREDDYIRPVFDQAMRVNPGRIKLFASPWSPPAWMKTNKHLNGNIGILSDNYTFFTAIFFRILNNFIKLGISLPNGK